MVKVHFFGTRSGTEPMEGMHHTSMAVEVSGVYYYVDAGENCAYSSHLSGVDHLNIKAIFITHPHMDHVGGLAGLIWNIRKLTRISDRRPIEGKVHLVLPALKTWEGILMLLRTSEKNFDSKFDIVVEQTRDGLVYEDENIKVTAFHNCHMQEEEGEGWISYSYVVETEEKKIVFSGDLRDVKELDDAIGEKCDLLIMETGHHQVVSVGEYVDSKKVGKLIFNHHGREIIFGRSAAREKLKAFKTPAVISYDGMVEEMTP